MSVDNFHKDVESAMKHTDKVCDWEDFTTCVSKHRKAVDMLINDFYNFPNASSHSKKSKETKPLLSSIFVAKFQVHNFLQNQNSEKYQEQILAGTCKFNNKEKHWINKDKRRNIIEKLVQLMDDPKRTEFYLNMKLCAEASNMLKMNNRENSF